MIPKKRLQVFVSSTFTDLIAERQAAVEAILTAGHIPAGMELFAAGDRSQMEVIRRWIDESDVYVLLLGGRYGSLDPASGKSYTHLEYEYAISRGMPLFAVVVDADHQEVRVRRHGTSVTETENPQKLKELRALVTSRMVRFWRDPKDIKLAVLETLSEFARRDGLRGWVPGDRAVDSGVIAQQLAEVTRENAELRRRLEARGDPRDSMVISGLSHREMHALLGRTTAPSVPRTPEVRAAAAALGGDEPSLLHYLWANRERLLTAFVRADRESGETDVCDALAGLGILLLSEYRVSSADYQLTAEGRAFLLRLMVDHPAPGA